MHSTCNERQLRENVETGRVANLFRSSHERLAHVLYGDVLEQVHESFSHCFVVLVGVLVERARDSIDGGVTWQTGC